MKIMKSSKNRKKLVIIILFVIGLQSFAQKQEKIVFTKNLEIHSMNVDGSNIIKLTNYKVPRHTPISCRPSMTKLGNIAYIYDPVRHGWMSTYVMNGNGSNKTRISKEPKSKASSTWESVISPDGKYYAFTSNRSNNDEIYRMNYDGTNVINISNTHENEGAPKWSPDGKQIIYSSANSKGGFDIVITNVEDEHKKVLIHSNEELADVAFSKDGGMIAYRVVKSNSSDLMIANVDGSNIKKIKSINKWSRLSFSPDNKYIAFVSKNGKITTMKLDGSEYKELTNGIDPVWSF